MISLPWAVILGLLLTVGLPTVYAGWIGAPFAPTPRAAVDAALALARVGPQDTFVDFGAGDGRMIIAAARRGARAIGYELSPFLWTLAFWRVRASRSGATVRFGNALSADYSRVTAVFLFLVPRTLPVVLKRLAPRLAPGTRIVTYAFPLHGWTPAGEVVPSGCAPVRLYVVPVDTASSKP